MDRVIKVFSTLAMELDVSLETIDYFSSGVISKIKKNGLFYKDYILHLGEYFNAKLITAYLKKNGMNAKFVDPMHCIFFHKDGSLLKDKSYVAIRSMCSGPGIFIIPGFYGHAHDGRVKVFPFNGSDVTGAIFSAALNPKLYDKGTAIGGIYSGDPRIEGLNPKLIEKMTLSDLRKLTYLGMSAVHPDTLSYLFATNTTMRIRNPNISEHMGTLVLPEITNRKPVVIGLAGKGNFVVVSIRKNMMNEEVGQALKVLSILSDFRIPLEHTLTGIDTMCFVIDASYLTDKEFPYNTELVSKIQHSIHANEVQVIKKIAVLSVVWTEFDSSFDLTITSALVRNGIKYLDSSGGAFSGQKLIFLNEEDLNLAHKSIHKEFFG